MSERGFSHATEIRRPDQVVVRFRQTGITPSSVLAQVFERYPATGRVLTAHGLDLCCGGAHSIETVARAHGLDPAALLDDQKHLFTSHERPRRMRVA